MVEKAAADEIFKHSTTLYEGANICDPIPKYGAPDNQIILKGEISSPINIETPVDSRRAAFMQNLIALIKNL